MLQKFSVRNLDCANCADKVENVLNRTAGVKSAVLDFPTLTLRIDAEDIDSALNTIRDMEPDIEILPISGSGSLSGNTAETGKPAGGVSRWVLLRMVVAAVLFIDVIAVNHWFYTVCPPDVIYAVAIFAYLLAGWDVFKKAARTLKTRDYFDEHVLMLIATMGAIAIGATSEAVAVMLFYKAGETLQGLAVSRSRHAIRSLLAARPDSATVILNGRAHKVSPEHVGVGETILIRPGEKVPLDGSILSGDSLVDTSALTGESVPQTVGPGDAVMAGQINQTGVLSVVVDRPFTESSIVKMLELVQNAASRKARTENFITTFSRVYTPAVVAISAGIALIPPLLISGALLDTWVYRALVLLVISCPCALVISIPLGYFGGIGRASRQGILIKGSNFIDALAKVKTVVFDKTGTLTRGVFVVRKVVPKNGYTSEQVLEYAAIAEYHSRHPIARSIQEAYTAEGKTIDPDRIGSYTEASGRGVRVNIDQKSVLAGNADFMEDNQICREYRPVGGTVVHVSCDGLYAGYILIGDRLREEAAETFSSLRKNGVKQIVMLTGDNQQAADIIAGRLNLDAYTAGLLPEQKVMELERILSEKTDDGKVAFVGDGINDAPVLARADVGVAMGALGSDAAVEVADVVLMSDSPMKMAEAIAIGRHTRIIVWQNIVFALAVKGVFLTLGAIGIATMWEAVFADVGTTVLAVFNSMRTLGTKV